jgi:GT2 family glycosyltransferase
VAAGADDRARRTNGGFSVANNEGIRATSGEFVLLLNSDTIVPPGALDALVARLAAEPSVAVPPGRASWTARAAGAVVGADDRRRSPSCGRSGC